ncbi:hypothetical protein [Phenylobacterium sp.]|uniref:terminase small subunit-like protein n=1 Tax=Phenylobacterium sp. TaxID=1871053 RepID=UPI00286B8120|nr:hypothetical protein [Phenylobacterium sp.]
MPARAYAQLAPQARQQVLDRVSAGEPLVRICAEPGMPSYASVRAWSLAAPDFGAALAQARRKADRRLAFDEAKAATLLARLAAGEGIVAILRDPAMPSRRAYARWRATQGEFGQAVWRLNQVKTAARVRRVADRFRPFDQDLADAIVVRVSRGQRYQALLTAAHGLPTRAVVTRWRKARPEFDQALRIALRVGARRRGQARAACPSWLAEAICEGIAEGGSLHSLSALPDIPCAATLYGWMRTQPAFAAAVAEAQARRKAQAASDAERARLLRAMSGV